MRNKITDITDVLNVFHRENKTKKEIRQYCDTCKKGFYNVIYHNNEDICPSCFSERYYKQHIDDYKQ